ncbi:MAG: hypothetical protein M0Z66_04045 [Thermaerobacter sp.]|nr:hypothetical protein [Thermaerobacter sp.]
MAAYRDREEMVEIFATLAERAASSQAAKLLHNSRMVVSFVYRNPDLVLVMDGRTAQEGEPPMLMRFDTAEPKPDVTFECSADVGHQFWLGKLDVPQALGRGIVKARGSIAKALKLLPMMPPLYDAYRQVLSERGGLQGGDLR